MGILGLLISLGSLIAGIGSNVSAANKQDKYQKKIEKKQEKDRKMQTRDVRKNALARAIKSDNTYAPYIEGPTPAAPTTTPEAVTDGISNVGGWVGGQMISTASANDPLKKKPQQPVLAYRPQNGINVNEKYNPNRYA
jgi:hypothetical protein